MGQFSYEEQGAYTWLVYRMEENDEIDSLSLGMLTKNNIPGIMPIVYTPLNNKGYIKYNVSSRINAKDFLTGMVNRERILGVFSGIINGMTSAESYMLDAGSIMLDLEYIFVNVSTIETNMVCVPVQSGEQKHIDLAGFFRNILFSVQFEPSESFEYVTQMVNYLNSTHLFSLEEFRKLVEKLRREQGTGGGTPLRTDIVPETVGQRRSAAFMGSPSDTVQRESRYRETGVVLKEKSAEETALPVKNAGETGFAIPGGVQSTETQNAKQEEGKKGWAFFGGAKAKKAPPEGKKEKGRQEKKGGKAGKKSKKEAKAATAYSYDVPGNVASGNSIPMTDDELGSSVEYGATADDFEMPGVLKLTLEYLTENRTIPVSHFPFEIGRDGSGLKIDVSKAKVSRRHAVITQAGDSFLITDFSKHGTYLNGDRIPQGEPKLLTNNMRILLKTEEFEVKISKI